MSKKARSDAGGALSYGPAAALRYRIVQSGPGGFASRMAPRIQRRFEDSRADATVPPRILDIGCGTGQLLRFFEAAGYAITGVDPSADMLAQARALGLPATALVAGGVERVVGERCFDLITATFNVLNHVADHDALDRLLGDVVRLLDRDGLFLFDINTPRGLQATSELSETSHSDTFHTHWMRQWEGDRLTLHASGWFDHDGRRHDYNETIHKIRIEPFDLAARCEALGLSQLHWLSDDLLTPLDRPQDELVAFGVASVRR